MAADGRWLLEDASSTNGTFAAGQRVRRVEITDSCQVRPGHPEAGPVLSCSVTDRPDRDALAQPSATAVWSAQRTAGDRFPSAIMPLPAKVLRIGRAAADSDWW